MKTTSSALLVLALSALINTVSAQTIVSFDSTNGYLGAIDTASLATYHVRTNGSDATGDGSSGKPWATLKHACANVAADQRHTILLGPGTFTDADRTNASNTPAILPRNVSLTGSGKTLTTYIGQINVPLVQDQIISDFFIDGRENTIADSTLFRGLIIEKGTKLIVRDMRIEGFHSYGLQFGLYDGLSGSKLHNCELVNNGKATSRGFGMRTGNMVNCEIHDNMFLEERGKGGEIWNSGNRTFTNVKIFNNRFKTHKDKAAGWNNQEVFNFELWNVDCLGVDVYNNRFDGSVSLVDPASPRTNKSPYSIRLHHNRWDYTIRYAIEAVMAGMCIDSNHFHFGISTDPDMGGAYGGIVSFTDKKHDHIRIHHNVFENYPLYAIHNLTGDHIKIYNNTAIAGRSEEVPSYWTKSSPRFLTLGRNVTRSNLTMVNNVFYADANRPGTFLVQDSITPDPVLSQIQSNVMWNTTPGMTPSLLALADIEAPREQNPVFVRVGDKPAPYYSLAANSPLIDAGIFLEGLHAGYLGAAPDIGAVEFLSPPTLVREGSLTPVSHHTRYTRAYDLRGRLLVSDRKLHGTAKQAASALIWVNGQGSRKKDLLLR